VHEPAQSLLVPHIKGAHDVVCAAGQVPLPSHDAGSVLVPAVQLWLRQGVVLGG
jgi:hypothetical protein